MSHTTDSAIATDAQLKLHGYRYWSPGPVPGSVWAIDEAGEPVLRGNVTPLVAARAAELRDASKDYQAQTVYLYGRLFGIITRHFNGRRSVKQRVVIPCDVDIFVISRTRLEASYPAGAVTYGGHP